MKTIGFIGVGKMATAIISGLDKNKFKIIISGHNLTKTQKQAETLNVTAASNHEELVQESDFIILSVKPQVLPSVLSKLINHLTKDKTLISIAAGLTLSDLKHLADSENQPIIRVMPNINAQIGQSTSAIVKNEFVVILLMLQFKKFLNQLVLSMKLLKKIFQHLQQLPVQALLLFICS